MAKAKSTIALAITAAFELTKKPMTLQELCKTISKERFYKFNTPTPEDVLRIEIRRRCQNVNLATSRANREFLELPNKTYSLISAVPTPAPEIVPAAKTTPKENTRVIRVKATVLKPVEMPVSPRKDVRFNNSDKEDFAIIEAIRSGTSAEKRMAEERLYKKYSPYIMQKALRSVNQDVDMAQDLTVEIMTKVFAKLDTYAVEFSVNTWMSRIISNHITDAARKRAKYEGRNISLSSYGATEDHEGAHSDLDIRDSERNPEQIAILSQRDNKLERAMGMLKPQTCQALQMYYYENRSQDEIANHLGIAYGQLKALMFRGREKLREILGSSVEMHA